jgi:hypothetical protein
MGDELVRWEALINREPFLRMLNAAIAESDTPEAWGPLRRVIEREQGKSQPFRVSIKIEDWES